MADDAVAVVVFVAFVHAELFAVDLSPGLRCVADVVAAEIAAAGFAELVGVLAHDGEYRCGHEPFHHLRPGDVHDRRGPLDFVHVLEVMRMLCLIPYLHDRITAISPNVPDGLHPHLARPALANLLFSCGFPLQPRFVHIFGGIGWSL